MSELRMRQVNVRRWLPLIAGLAVGVRVGLAIVHPFEFPDSADYDALARAMLEHRPYEAGGYIAARMPGYPIFVAVVYAVAGYGAQGVLIAQGLLSSMVVVLTYAIGKQIAGSRGTVASLVAAALLAVDPLSIGFSASFLTEMPFTLLLVISLWICLRLVERPRFWEWIWLGVCWGAAVSLRVSALWCIVPLVFWTAWCSGKSAYKATRGVKLVGPVMGIMIVFLMLFPWLSRNYSYFHSGALRLTTLEGISLYEAVYPEADGGPKQDKITLPADMQLLSEAERNDEWSRRGWAYVAHDPLRIGKLAIIKIGRTWAPYFNAAEFRSPMVQLAMMLWYIPLFILGLWGLFKGRMAHSSRVLLLIPMLYFTLVHALFLGSVRYRVPLMPIVCIFAASGITRMWNCTEGGKPSEVSGV